MNITLRIVLVALVAFATSAKAQASSAPVKVSFEDPFASNDILVIGPKRELPLPYKEETEPNPPTLIIENYFGNQKTRSFYDHIYYSSGGRSLGFHSESTRDGPGGTSWYNEPSKTRLQFSCSFPLKQSCFGGE
jgi:hypothetical protein